MWPILVAFAAAAPPPGKAPPEPRDLPGEVMPERGWDFEHLELRVRVFVSSRRIEGRAVHTVSRLVPDTTVVRLHQVGLDVTAVEVDGRQIDGFRLVGDWLEVPVGAEGERHEIAIAWRAAPQTGLHFRGGPNARPGERLEAWSQGEGQDNRHWFPSWDYPNDKLTVRTTVEAPLGLSAFANGVLEGKREVDSGFVAWTYALDRPIASYLVAVAVGDYEVYADEGDETAPRFEYVVQRQTGEATARGTFDRVRDQLTWFADLLGEPFPYPIYRQLAVQGFLYGAMENASFTIVNDHRLVAGPRGSELRADTLVAHELAHQWFGDLLTCYGWRELWLNEGFATYYAGRWQEHALGPDRAAELVQRWQSGALRDRDAPMAARAASKLADRDNAAVYLRGASVLHMLRVYLGTEVFDRGIRRYVARWRDSFVESDQLRRALEDESGRHLGWFFDQWVTGSGVAKLVSRHEWEDGALEVRIEQSAPVTPFSAEVKVEIGQVDGSVETARMWLGSGSTRLILPLSLPPRYVAVDPEGGVLAEWDRRQSTREWAAQATSAVAPYARLVAITALGTEPVTDAGLEALASIAGDPEERPAFRRAAATALGNTQDLRSVEALLPLLDADVDLALAAVDALGALQLRTSIPAIEGLRRLLRAADAPAELRARGLVALAALDPDAARKVARDWLGRPDPTAAESFHDAAAEALGEVSDPADLDLLISRLDEARSRPVGLIGAGDAAVDIAAERDPDDPDREALAEAIAPLLASRNIRLRQSAIGWLGRIGTAESENALERFADRNHVAWERLSDRARDAAAQIRNRMVPETPPPLPDLERLRQELDSLDQRLDELETWK